MNEQQKKEYYEKIDALEQKFENEREEINAFIKEHIILKLSDIKEIANVQVHAASQRQRMSDKISSLRAKIRKHSEKQHQERKDLYYLYKTKANVRLADPEINKQIEADLEPKNNFRQVLENQIDFYRRTIESIDKIGFAIKYLIEHHRFINGGY